MGGLVPRFLTGNLCFPGGRNFPHHGEELRGRGHTLGASEVTLRPFWTTVDLVSAAHSLRREGRLRRACSSHMTKTRLTSVFHNLYDLLSEKNDCSNVGQAAREPRGQCWFQISHQMLRWFFFFYILCKCISSEVLRCSTGSSPRSHWEVGSRWRPPGTGI